MDYNRIIEEAKKMEFNFLFYTPEHQEDFLKNIDNNLVIENDKSIFFIDCTGNEAEVFWAGTTMDEVISGLYSFKNSGSCDSDLHIKCGEDKTCLGLLDRILPYFLNEGLTIKFHRVGYKTPKLDVINEFPLVDVAEIQDMEKIFNLICETLGERKFDMEIDELDSYINENNKCLFIIRSNEKIVGLVLASIYGEGKYVFIRGLGVDENYRGLGYSSQLLSKVFSWAKEKGVENSMLWVEKDNSVAISLYEKYGYYPYGDQEVTLLYSK